MAALPEKIFKYKRDIFIRKNSPEGSKTISEILTCAGIAIILYYYNQKEKSADSRSCPAYVAENIETLKYALGLLRQAKEATEFGIICPILKHFVAIKCEKIQGQNRIILMDSFGSLSNNSTQRLSKEMHAKNHAEAFANIVAELFSKDAKDTFIYINQEARQSEGEIGAIFALKDIRKMMRTRLLSDNIHSNKFIVSKVQNKGVTVFTYRTPPEYMRLTQSQNKLENYINEYPENSAEIQRVIEEDAQNLRAYALTSRDGYGVKTPEAYKNKNYNSENPHEPKYIYRNLTIVYFGKKYITMIDKALESNDHIRIAKCLKTRNAKYLKIGPDGSVMSQIEENFMLEQQKKQEQEEEQTTLLKQQSNEERDKKQTLEFRQKGILMEDDIITTDEIFDYIHSQANFWNSSFSGPSFSFSNSSLIPFAFDRVSYMKEIAQELRNKPPEDSKPYLMQNKGLSSDDIFSDFTGQSRQSDEQATEPSRKTAGSASAGTKRKTRNFEESLSVLATVKRNKYQ